MFTKRLTHKNCYLILSSYLEELLNLKRNQLFHYHQKVDHQNVTNFTLNGNQEHQTMKKHQKHLKIPIVLIKRATSQFKTVYLRNRLKLHPLIKDSPKHPPIYPL